MSSQYIDNGKPNVVVVGGGFGAVTTRAISRGLDVSSHNLILITPREHRIHLIAAARMVVSDRDSLDKVALADYSRVFHNKGTIIRAAVASVEKTEKTGGFVTLESGEQIPFKVLVVATGSNWVGPLAFPNSDVPEWLKVRRQEFTDAKNIVLVGAGAVGLELSGEIKDVWPEKSITIIHNSKKVLNDAYPDKYRSRVESDFIARGVKFVFDDFLEDLPSAPGPTTIRTRNGKTLEADLVVPTWGARPNTDLLKSLGPDVLADNGCVKVAPSLQLVSHPEIFALGDIIDWKEQKQYAKADLHSGVVAANVLSYLSTGVAKKKYKGSIEMIALTNGKEGGVTYVGILWGLVNGAWFTRLIKSRNLFISQFRASTGL